MAIGNTASKILKKKEKKGKGKKGKIKSKKFAIKRLKPIRSLKTRKY